MYRILELNKSTNINKANKNTDNGRGSHLSSLFISPGPLGGHLSISKIDPLHWRPWPWVPCLF